MLFFSPIAWIALIILIVQSALIIPDFFNGSITTKLMGKQPWPGITNNFVRMYFTNILSYIYLYIPLLTMGIVSRELNSGSIKLLYSSPITNTQIILGKYLSMVIYGLTMMAVICIFAGIGLGTIVRVEYGMILSSLLGLFLVICTYSAIGIFVSSITSYQIVAAMGTFAILTGLNLISKYGQEYAFVREVTWWLSINGRAGTFLKGLLCSEDILYFLIVPAMFIMLTIHRLNAIRQKMSIGTAWSRYALIVVIASVAGFITSRPQFMGYFDATSTDMNTLTKESQTIMKNLDGPLTITTYVNGMDPESRAFGIRKEVMRDMSRFEQFVRFKPEIKLKYVRYYDTLATKTFDWMHHDLMDKYFDKGMEALLARSCYVKGRINPKEFKLTGEEVARIEDVASEGMTFFRTIERGNGKKVTLRIYDDPQVFPRETEIAAAMKRLYLDAPKVAFITGHQQRDVKNFPDRGFRRFSFHKAWRYSLLNQGFDTDTLSLTKPIPEDIDILVIADIKTALSEVEMENFKAYIARGGNLVLMNDMRRQAVMNPINNLLGIEALPGIVVSKTGNSTPDLTLSRPTKEGKEMSPYFAALAQRSYYYTTMPNAVMLNIDKVKDKGFNSKVILTSKPGVEVWNEKQTTDFIDYVPELQTNTGEIAAKNIPTAIALSRQFNGKEQKIMVFADADCFSNSEIELKSRAGIQGVNYTMMMGTFHWLCDGVYPVDMSRPPLQDNDVRMTREGAKVVKFIVKWFLPGLLLLLALYIWIRRRSR